jgi:hypothetical protein
MYYADTSSFKADRNDRLTQHLKFSRQLRRPLTLLVCAKVTVPFRYSEAADSSGSTQKLGINSASNLLTDLGSDTLLSALNCLV